jgi:hypothetical protein
MAAIHSASMDGRPNAGPQTWSWRTMAGCNNWVTQEIGSDVSCMSDNAGAECPDIKFV